MDYSPPGSFSMGFSRQEYWNELPFPSPGVLPNPRIEPVSPAWQVASLLLGHRGSRVRQCAGDVIPAWVHVIVMPFCDVAAVIIPRHWKGNGSQGKRNHPPKDTQLRSDGAWTPVQVPLQAHTCIRQLILRLHHTVSSAAAATATRAERAPTSTAGSSTGSDELLLVKYSDQRYVPIIIIFLNAVFLSLCQTRCWMLQGYRGKTNILHALREAPIRVGR